MKNPAHAGFFIPERCVSIEWLAHRFGFSRQVDFSSKVELTVDMRRLPDPSTVIRQRICVDGDALRPPFATALGGMVQPNQTLGA